MTQYLVIATGYYDGWATDVLWDYTGESQRGDKEMTRDQAHRDQERKGGEPQLFGRTTLPGVA